MPVWHFTTLCYPSWMWLLITPFLGQSWWPLERPLTSLSLLFSHLLNGEDNSCPKHLEGGEVGRRGSGKVEVMAGFAVREWSPCSDLALEEEPPLEGERLTSCSLDSPREIGISPANNCSFSCIGSQGQDVSSLEPQHRNGFTTAH